MLDLTHLDAIDLRLSHERARVTDARNAKDRAFREHNVRMIERERVGELAFLAKQGYVEPAPMSLDDIPAEIDALDDDELLAQLGA